MKVYYGVKNNYKDITNICLTKLTYNNIITIPHNDIIRAIHFGDHIYGVLKNIVIYDEINDIYSEYNDNCTIYINIINNTIRCINYNSNNSNTKTITEKLINIQSKLQIKYGTFNEELPEQKMAVRYLKGHEKVLEIGGNIGRNSLVIASLLNNSKNLVTLECSPDIFEQLKENRELNGLYFSIEDSALSNRKLIQKDWDTIPSDTLIDGYSWVKTITLEELMVKYNTQFDTLVLDCEGAFYYILNDMPEILNNIKLIIMENDYWDILKKKYIDDILRDNHFYVDYVESGGWGPCMSHFFEVWKRVDSSNTDNSIISL